VSLYALLETDRAFVSIVHDHVAHDTWQIGGVLVQEHACLRVPVEKRAKVRIQLAAPALHVVQRNATTAHQLDGKARVALEKGGKLVVVRVLPQRPGRVKASIEQCVTLTRARLAQRFAQCRIGVVQAEIH
jgi:hypothetical protein